MLDNNSISSKLYNYLYIKEPRVPSIYFLPKIHKDILPPPVRPILSANDCPTERISAFVDFFLKPLVKKIPSYIKDTADLINKIEALPPLPENTLLVTMDVQSLYTNIPTDEGLRSSARALLHNRDHHDKPSTTELISLLRLVLTCNNFEFNGEHFLQINGTAMGTKVAPSFANIFMAESEETHLLKHTLLPLVWWRFIDDIFCIWTYSETDLQEFMTYLNSCHPTIKFTCEYSQTQVNFLDTTIKFVSEHRAYTTLYVKPTDTHTYLHYRSAHPRHSKSGGPYSQLLRVKRICSKVVDYEENAQKILHYYILRGYPTDRLEESKNKVDSHERATLLAPKQNESTSDQENFF